MAVRNFEIQKKGEGYVIAEQAGSNYHREVTSHEAPDRKDAVKWLCGQGGAPDLVEQAFDDLQSTNRVYVQMAGDYSEAENFPKL